MVFQPTFFAPIIQYVAIVKSEDLIFEVCDNFQKQTYRNRSYIYGANGRLLLNVPILHEKGGQRQKTRDIKIGPDSSWRNLHKKSLSTAYRSSPYFEFFEDDIFTIFDPSIKYLLDLNLKANELVLDALQLDLKFKETEEYQINFDKEADLRYLADAKSKVDFPFEFYHQVFNDKHGFIPNLSILDLLFNEGPNALDYLERHTHLIP